MGLAVVLVDVALNYFSTKYRVGVTKIAMTFRSVVTLSMIRSKKERTLVGISKNVAAKSDRKYILTIRLRVCIFIGSWKRSSNYE